jgi:hypothetical protein
MATIYRKTAKGHEEIQTRAHRLLPRLRSALILVDGQRSDEELARLLPVSAEVLGQLLEQGFIELLAELAALPPRVAAPAPPPAPALPDPGPSTLNSLPGPASLSPGSPAPARVRNFPLIQREAVRRLNETLGPAAETLAIRMERCKDLETLRPLLVNARQMIANLRGSQAGDDYITALSSL